MSAYAVFCLKKKKHNVRARFDNGKAKALFVTGNVKTHENECRVIYDNMNNSFIDRTMT